MQMLSAIPSQPPHKWGTVVPIRPWGLAAYDVEQIMIVAALMDGGRTPFKKMTICDQPIDWFLKHHGKSDVLTANLACPAYQWNLPDLRRSIVIDQGTLRITFYALEG